MPEAPSPIPEDSAIARCLSARQSVYREELAKGKTSFSAARDAAAAYRSAMPSLSGQENIRDFVACVAHGMLLGTIEGKNATKLLYAAQVALSAIRRQPSPPGARAA